jgi:hypothetical protein
MEVLKNRFFVIAITRWREFVMANTVGPGLVITDQVRASDQHKNVEGTGPYIPASVSCTHGPRNRLIGMSAFRPKGTSAASI